MGLKNRDGLKTSYVKVKDGKFYLSTDKELTAPFDELTGIMTDAFLKDEDYLGVPQRKMYIALEDADGKYLLGLNIESSMASSLIGFLANADLSREVALVPRMEKTNKNGKDIEKRTILVAQDGKFLKSKFTKENPNGLPPMQKVERRGGKIEWIKDEMLDFYEDLIINTFKVQASKNKGSVPAVTSENGASVTTVSDSPNKGAKLPWSSDDDEDGEDLPF